MFSQLLTFLPEPGHEKRLISSMYFGASSPSSLGNLPSCSPAKITHAMTNCLRLFAHAARAWPPSSGELSAPRLSADVETGTDLSRGIDSFVESTPHPAASTSK